VNPIAYLQQVSGQLDRLTQRDQIEPVLDELEYLYEILDPELQAPADQLIDTLRKRLEQLA